MSTYAWILRGSTDGVVPEKWHCHCWTLVIFVTYLLCSDSVQSWLCVSLDPYSQLVDCALDLVFSPDECMEINLSVSCAKMNKSGDCFFKHGPTIKWFYARNFLHLFLAFFFWRQLFTDIWQCIAPNAEVDGYLCMLHIQRLFIHYFINILVSLTCDT